MKIRGPATADRGKNAHEPTASSGKLAAQVAQELAHMAVAGENLRETHPGLAKFLTRQAQDPDVERLIEATAYLCSQVKARVDACAPELMSELADRVAPWVLRDIPPACIAHIDVPVVQDRSLEILPKHQVLRAQGNAQGAVFRTVAPTTLWPMRLARWQVKPHVDGHTQIMFTLETNGKLRTAALADLGIDLYLDGPLHQAQSLVLALTQGALSVTVCNGDTHGAWSGYFIKKASEVAQSLTPMFEEDPPLPQGAAALRDFFVLPHKNLFTTLRLHEIEDCPLATTVTVTAIIHQDFGSPNLFNEMRPRINCVAISNVTRADAIPLRVRPGVVRYLLRPQPQEYSLCSSTIMAVHEAHITHGVGAKSQPLFAAHSYRARGDEATGKTSYTLRLPASLPTGEALCQMDVHGLTDVPQTLSSRTVSMQLWCHNGAKASDVPAHTLTFAVDHPRALRASNVCATSAVVPALRQEASREALVALITQGGRCHLHRDDVVRMLLVVAPAHDPDSPAYRAQMSVIHSITKVHTAQSMRLWRNAHVLCLDITLEIDVTELHSLGQAYAFADCLAVYWADAQPINGVMRLQMHCRAWGRTITWPLTCGGQTFGEMSCTTVGEHR